MRIVVDTNIFISSFFGGNPRKIIELWKSGRVILCLSGPIIDEYVEVLTRMGLVDSDELKDLLRLFARGFNSVFAGETPDLKIVEKDPDDDKFIECAAALDSGFIITGDKALQEIREYAGIKIRSAKQFLDDFNS